MKTYFLIATLSAILFLGFIQPQQSGKGTPVVLIELFTSEGCSSCPPADSYMNELVKNNPSVYVLAFHVDYWDYLGWKDKFASPAYTERQRKYGNYFKQKSIYTPEAVVNGKIGIVGSDRIKMESLIKKEKRISSSSILNIEVKKNGEQLTIEYAVKETAKNLNINFALVENEILSKVTSGENSGENLLHTNVVRQFSTDKLKELEGNKIISIPTSLHHVPFRLMVYVQDAETLEIYSASQVAF